MGVMRPAPAAQATQVTPELVMELQRPLEVELSPDGSQVAFTVSATFREKNKGIESRLWLGDVAGEDRKSVV
jgi:hypothetical protein